MTSFKDIRDVLILSHGANFISDEELILLYDEFKPTNLSFPHSLYGDFDLENMDDDECVAEFRVKKKYVETLAEALQIPENFYCYQRSKVDGMEGLCMLLRRFASPEGTAGSHPPIFSHPCPWSARGSTPRGSH